MAFPALLDAAELAAGPSARGRFLRELDAACREVGVFRLRNHGIPDGRWGEVIDATSRFFARPQAEKDALHLRHTTNYRGYSQLRNSRDWREQLHWGWEWPEGAWTEGLPEYQRLAGANPWPDEAFAGIMIRYMEDVQALGLCLLGALAECLGVPSSRFEPASGERPYLLLKQLCYFPQPEGDLRPGVAPHCDWSWLTILLQDDTGGLEVQDPEGGWAPVPPEPGVLSVNLGELMEIVSRGRYRAAPHRVINPANRCRISIPAFINPPLNAWIEPWMGQPVLAEARPEPGHVHRVVPRGVECGPFVFGDSEWRRKGLGRWCHDERCLTG